MKGSSKESNQGGTAKHMLSPLRKGGEFFFAQFWKGGGHVESDLGELGGENSYSSKQLAIGESNDTDYLQMEAVNALNVTKEAL